MAFLRSDEIITQYIDEQVNIALSRYSFWEFCLYYDLDFFTKRSFLSEVAEAFQYLYEEYKQGRARKIAVSMSPRSGKSYIGSLFAAWWLGKFPELSVMRNTCTARLYQKFSYDVRNIIKSKKWGNVFPKLELASDKQNIDGWNLTTAKQVSYFGAGVGGTIIGFGANLAMSDDLYKDMTDALSEIVQEGVSVWKESAHNSRMETNCPEIFLGTRWTKNDEIGKAQDKGYIDKQITIPALDANGNSFCENVKTTAEYQKIKAETEESIWSAEYQQEPIELAGLLFPASELKYSAPIDREPEHKYLFVDNSDTGDYTSAPICYLYENRVYVVGVVFNRDGTDITIPQVVETIISRKMNHAEIEGNSAWILYAKEVRNKVTERYEDCEIRIVKNSTNKETRIKTHSPFVKNHFVFLQEQYWDKEYRAFMKNLTSYLREGGSKHDDGPDAMAGAASYFMRNFGHLW